MFGFWCDSYRNWYSSGNIYDGEWFANVRHGNGVMNWKNRNERYSGSWKDGEQDGEGEYVWFQTRIAGSQYVTLGDV